MDVLARCRAARLLPTAAISSVGRPARPAEPARRPLDGTRRRPGGEVSRVTAPASDFATGVSPRRCGGARAPRADTSAGTRGSFSSDRSATEQAAAAPLDGSSRTPLTTESADLALNDVRPYLIADGGEITVEGVEDGVVSVRFRGACSTCESSSATLRLGVEKTLRDAFGDSLRGVVDVGPEPEVVNVGLADVDASLDAVRGALRAMGATVETVGFQDGVCTLWYEGPPALAKGVRDAVMERFRGRVTAVRVVDPSTSEVLLDA